LIELKKDLFSGIMGMGFENFRGHPVSYYVSMVQRDVKTISTGYYDSVCGIFRIIVSFSFSFVVLIQMNPWICVLNVVIAFSSVFLPRMMRNRIQSTAKKATQYAAEYQGVVNDALQGFSTIKIFSITDQINKAVEAKNEKYEQSEYQSVKINYEASFLSITFTQFGFIATLALGAFFVLQGKITVGAVVAISQLIGGILAPFQELPLFLTNLQATKVIKEKMEEIIDRNERQEEVLPIDIDDHKLTCENLSVMFDEKTALQDVTLSFEENKKYILIGESGCGKSTLAKVLMGMVKKDKGSVLLGGKSIDSFRGEQLCQIVTYMQQDVFLFDDTLWNNITLYKDYSASEVESVIDCVGLREYVKSLEEGLNTKINGNGYNISGGERQRIGIARALLSGAQIMIMDEITSSLDVVLEKQIQETVLGLENVTVIMITHDLRKESLQKADEIIVIRKGVISEKGTYDDLMARKGLLHGYMLLNE